MSDYQNLDYAALLAELQPRLIRTDAEYRRRLTQIEALMRPDPSPDVSAMIELLALILEAWENERYPTPESSPEQIQRLEDPPKIIEAAQRTPFSMTSEQFRRDPKAGAEIAARYGRALITDEQGRPVAAISVPTGERPICSCDLDPSLKDPGS